MGDPFEAVIGLEIHCQLQTASKAFSPDPAAFTAEPNDHVDPVSLGHPGTLPVLNARAVDFAVALGLATQCSIERNSVLARKHYFYPDLPKGYQISQYDRPICVGGRVDIGDGSGGERFIRLTRIHLEEDAGRSVHDQDPVATLLDYNRCGVPLVEIVTEPDVRTPAEAGRFMKRIRQIVRYLGISDGNMEEGSLRCDANVSIRPVSSTELGTKTEIKNLNSFRHVERAIEHEIGRQTDLLRRGERIVQETRLWDDVNGTTRSLRSKEEAHDYRYFPDPDLPPIRLSQDHVDAIRAKLPRLAPERVDRYVRELGLPVYDAELLTEERATADYFEGVLARLAGSPDQTTHAVPEAAPKTLSNLLMSLGMRHANERETGFAGFPVDPSRMASLVRMRLDDSLSSSGVQELFEAMLIDERPADVIARERSLLQVSDVSALIPYVDRVVDTHPDNVALYRSGKTGLIGFFIGQVMKTFPGSADPRLVRRLVEERLSGNA